MKMKLHNRGAGRGAGQGAGQAFTLVELLVVISIIGVLAALILPLASSVARVKKENTAQAELQQIETALENYKAKNGAYPPSNPDSPLINQLYYELSGVTNNNGFYQTLDSFNSVSAANFSGQFHVGGIVNCSRGSGEDTVFAKDFLPGLKSTQVVVVPPLMGAPVETKAAPLAPQVREEGTSDARRPLGLVAGGVGVVKDRKGKVDDEQPHAHEPIQQNPAL